VSIPTISTISIKKMFWRYYFINIRCQCYFIIRCFDNFSTKWGNSWQKLFSTCSFIQFLNCVSWVRH